MLTLPTTMLEATTGLYTFQLVDENGAGIEAVQLDSLTLTHYDLMSEAILNSRDGQDVLNANDVTVLTTSGPPIATTVTWTMQAADTVIVDPSQRLEWHVLLFRWTWDSGMRAGAHQVMVGVENVRLVP